MKPNFSGEYVLNRGASALSPLVALSVETANIRIQHNEPTFSCEGRFVFLDQKTVQWAFELATNGGAGPPGPASMARLQWDGDTLVFTSREEAMTITFRYEVDRDGRLRMAEQLRATDHDQDNLWIFDRS